MMELLVNEADFLQLVRDLSKTEDGVALQQDLRYACLYCADRDENWYQVYLRRCQVKQLTSPSPQTLLKERYHAA
jgi:hypothetical protein